MRRIIVGAVLTVATLLAGTATLGAEPENLPRARSLRMERMMAEFQASMAAHDAWTNAELRKCKQLDAMKDEHACYRRIQPEIDRRKCAIYQRLEVYQESLYGRGGLSAGTSACKAVENAR